MRTLGPAVVVLALLATALPQTGPTATPQQAPRTAPQDARTVTWVRHVRNDIVKRVTAGTGVVVKTTGNAAFNVDVTRKMSSRLPLFFGEWTRSRDLPAVAGRTFSERWAELERESRS